MKERSKNYPGVYIYKSRVRKGDKCYYINYRANGTQVNEKVGWKSEGYNQAMAALVRSERVHATRHGNEIPDKTKATPTFADAWALYSDSLISVKEGRKVLNQQRYDKYLAPILGKSKLTMIAPIKLRSFIRKMELDGLHRSTIKHYLGLINRTFAFMKAEHGYTGENPMDKIKYHSKDRARQRYLTKAEAMLLLVEMKKASGTLYLQTVLGLFTGMRISEIMNIKGRDIGFVTNQIRVIGKGRNGVYKERHCEMNSVVKELLLRHPVDPYDKLFKRKFQRRAWFKVVDMLRFNEGIRRDDRIWRVTPHTMRHTFGSWLGQDGVSPMVIQQVMGHENIQTSMKYSKLGPRAGQTAVANLTNGVVL